MEEGLALPVLLLFPFAGAVLICLLPKGRFCRLLAVSVTAATAGLSVLASTGWLGMGGPQQYFSLEMGYPFSLMLDGFRAVHIVLVCLLWLLSLLFSEGYFAKTGEAHSRRYDAATLVTLGGTLGVFLSGNLFTCFFFFEIMSFASYLWVIQDKSDRSLKAGRLYLSASVISGMVMLMGLFLLNGALGTLEFSEMSAAAQAADKAGLYTAGALILVGFGTKAGMYPFHVWLPETYPAAPAPASALFSSVLSKTGIYGVMAVSASVFLHDSAWGTALVVLGLATMLWGGICALCAQDMKKLVSWSSMSQIGFILLGIGMQGILGGDNSLAVRGTVLHMLNHSVFKFTLFLLCGILFMQFGTHSFKKIKGYGRGHPVFGAAFLFAALGLAGVPLFSGYISKTLLHESIAEYARMSGSLLFTGVEWLFLISGGLTAAYMLKLGAVLFARSTGEPAEKKATALTMGCALIPVLVVPIAGIIPGLTMDRLADLGQGMVQGKSPAHAVAYFSPVNLVGAAISLGIGALLYFLLVRRVLEKRQTPLIKWDLRLEYILYRPVFQKLLPAVLGAVSVFMDRYVLSSLYRGIMFLVGWYARITANLADGFVELLVLVGFKPAKERDLGGKRVPAAYRLGTFLDRVAALFRRPKKEESYAESLSRYEQQSSVRRRMISASLSYGLLFAGLGLIIVLVYLIFS